MTNGSKEKTTVNRVPVPQQAGGDAGAEGCDRLNREDASFAETETVTEIWLEERPIEPWDDPTAELRLEKVTALAAQSVALTEEIDARAAREKRVQDGAATMVLRGRAKLAEGVESPHATLEPPASRHRIPAEGKDVSIDVAYPSTIQVGHMVGNFKIVAKLGGGTMGMVFLAEHPIIGSKVALKVIRPQFARNLAANSRFVNEAKAVIRIGNVHIVDISDFGTTSAGEPYFMMEYLQGETLAACVKRAGRLPPARALSIAAQIADALQASHVHGVVHRDLKPENIFLTRRDGNSDFVKVLDFGLAKLTIGQDAQIRNTGEGALMGTPYYMSPEQCAGKREIDHRADIYSLGVIFFEILTGRIPFQGRNSSELLVKHMTASPPAPSSIVPELTEALDAILFRALSKDPAHRFQTMADFRAELLGASSQSAKSQPKMGRSDSFGGALAPLPVARSETRIGHGLSLEPMPAAGFPPERSFPDEESRRPTSTLTGSVGEAVKGRHNLERPSRPAHSITLITSAALLAVAVTSAVAFLQTPRPTVRPGAPPLTAPPIAPAIEESAQYNPPPSTPPPSTPPVQMPEPLTAVNPTAEIAPIRKFPSRAKRRVIRRQLNNDANGDGVMKPSVH